MQYIVEIGLGSGEFTEAMERMRTWFDHQRIEPDGFRHSYDRAEMRFRVGFSVESQASAFARAFGGRLIGSPAGAFERAETETP